ncbi:DUF4829 domain-containing protein [Desulfosporosinus meridiei]|uniref:DUF4829 domain-containing protein n=1 Tax=Desulfosporosinus meridiei TaxID=79209 RepID=UPI0002314FBC|nr:DUF4829 domain-containing protein [Desulfosporosinus meridiei]
MKEILGLVLAVIVLISGCGSNTNSVKKTDLSNLTPTPTQIVETYYNSIATGDYSTAKNCLSDEIVQQYVNYPDSDFTNIKKLTDIKVSVAAPIKLHGKNFDEVQVTAKYVAEYKKVMTSDNGKQVRFIYVAKKEKDSPWKIISIGTGP